MCLVVFGHLSSDGPTVSLLPTTHLCLRQLGLEVLVDIHVTGGTAIYGEEKKSFSLRSSDRVSCTLYFFPQLLISQILAEENTK